MTELKSMREHLDEIYEDILIGFILELNKQNKQNGKKVGEELAKLTEMLRCWDV